MQWPPLQCHCCNTFKSQCFASHIGLRLQIKLPSLLMTDYARKYLSTIKELKANENATLAEQIFS